VRGYVDGKAVLIPTSRGSLEHVRTLSRYLLKPTAKIALVPLESGSFGPSAIGFGHGISSMPSRRSEWQRSAGLPRHEP